MNGILAAYTSAWKKLMQFNGRASRTEYWSFTLINAVLTMIIFSVFGSSLMSVDPATGVPTISFMYGVLILASIFIALAITVRRLHDTDRCGWWYLLALVPLANIALLVFMFLDSTPGDNRFGPSPKAAIANAV